METVNNALDIVEYMTREECTNPVAATRFLLSEMEWQGFAPCQIAHYLNQGYWELLPVDEANEMREEGANLILSDVGLCGLALIAW